jgi:hypothetical protein
MSPSKRLLREIPVRNANGWDKLVDDWFVEEA